MIASESLLHNQFIVHSSRSMNVPPPDDKALSKSAYAHDEHLMADQQRKRKAPPTATKQQFELGNIEHTQKNEERKRRKPHDPRAGEEEHGKSSLKEIYKNESDEEDLKPCAVVAAATSVNLEDADGNDYNKASSTPSRVVKRVKREWKKPDDMPKRPLSAYNLFFQSQRKELLGHDLAENHPITEETKRKHRKTHGKIGFKDMAKLISHKWHTADPQVKAIYEQAASVEKEKYNEAIKEYYDKKRKQNTDEVPSEGMSRSNSFADSEKKNPLPSLEIQPPSTPKLDATVNRITTGMSADPTFRMFPQMQQLLEQSQQQSQSASLRGASLFDNLSLGRGLAPRMQQEPYQGHVGRSLSGLPPALIDNLSERSNLAQRLSLSFGRQDSGTLNRQGDDNARRLTLSSRGATIDRSVPASLFGTATAGSNVNDYLGISTSSNPTRRLSNFPRRSLLDTSMSSLDDSIIGQLQQQDIPHSSFDNLLRLYRSHLEEAASIRQQLLHYIRVNETASLSSSQHGNVFDTRQVSYENRLENLRNERRLHNQQQSIIEIERLFEAENIFAAQFPNNNL